MLLEDKKYTLDELQIGMTVKANQFGLMSRFSTN